MVEIGVLKKPLRQWTAQEVAAALNGVITRDEEERILHNDMRGNVVKDFCCVDFLIYVLHLSRDTAIKIMEILQPFLDESEDVDEEVVLLDYCFHSKQRSSKNDFFTTESEAKKHNIACVSRTNGDTTTILNSTLKEHLEEEINAGGDEHMLEKDLNAQFEKLLDDRENTFSFKSCETQEDQLIHNESVSAKYM
ncbi:hypothetical protein Y032_0155g3032 [Ancylostoma ceylanicum]|uniref:Uncharacterized protein n=1 Tax=Ancylostoma ceylanicum TaxID=53326 RepID=A0A016SZJ2_9BILA|nr:hypothetical protein Y032_0155g3032 [Ancylostoma ceylanicum]